MRLLTSGLQSRSRLCRRPFLEGGRTWRSSDQPGRGGRPCNCTCTQHTGFALRITAVAARRRPCRMPPGMSCALQKVGASGRCVGGEISSNDTGGIAVGWVMCQTKSQVRSIARSRDWPRNDTPRFGDRQGQRAAPYTPPRIIPSSVCRRGHLTFPGRVEEGGGTPQSMYW